MLLKEKKMVEEFIVECPYGDVGLFDPIWYHSFDFNRNIEGITPIYNLYDCYDEFLLPEKMFGKTFLDVGTANGFFSFEMEKRGAEVVSYDLGMDDDTDKIPYPGSPDRVVDTREFIKKFHKGYWYAHKQFNSRARAVYGSVMKMPCWLGRYDVVFMGSILQHLRDPLGAILQADKHVKDTLIICEAYLNSKEPVMSFQANPEDEQPQYWTWWRMSPAFLVLALKSLGYQDIQVNGPFNLKNLGDGYSVASVTVKGKK